MIKIMPITSSVKSMHLCVVIVQKKNWSPFSIFTVSLLYETTPSTLIFYAGQTKQRHGARKDRDAWPHPPSSILQMPPSFREHIKKLDSAFI